MIFKQLLEIMMRNRVRSLNQVKFIDQNGLINYQ